MGPLTLQSVVIEENLWFMLMLPSLLCAKKEHLSELNSGIGAFAAEVYVLV